MSIRELAAAPLAVSLAEINCKKQSKLHFLQLPNTYAETAQVSSFLINEL